jgi:SM-20-related protein
MTGSPLPQLANWVDGKKLAPVFRAHGRLHIPDVLQPASAERLVRAMAGDIRWSNTVMMQGRGYDAPLDELAKAPAEKRREVAAYLAETARDGFQYDFDNWRISDELEAGRRHGGVLAPLEALWDFMNGEAFLGFVRDLTGDSRCAYCDAQATRYGAGHFLNAHDDGIAGKHRLYAYVLNLTLSWKVDWGGLLLFHDADGHVAEGYAPKFNALNIFRVPAWHSVSQVASFVSAHRLAVTGWIRSAEAKPEILR